MAVYLSVIFFVNALPYTLAESTLEYILFNIGI